MRRKYSDIKDFPLRAWRKARLRDWINFQDQLFFPVTTFSLRLYNSELPKTHKQINLKQMRSLMWKYFLKNYTNLLFLAKINNSICKVIPLALLPALWFKLWLLNAKILVTVVGERYLSNQLFGSV